MVSCGAINNNLKISLILLTLFLCSGFARVEAALPDESGYFELLKSKFELSRDNYVKALPEELLLFRSLFPRSAKTDSVEYMLGVMYDQNGQEAMALGGFLKIMYVYPRFERMPEVQAHLRRIASEQRRGIATIFSDENLKLLKQHVLQMTDNPRELPGGERGYLDFLQFLADSRVESQARFVIDECVHYLYRLGHGLEADRVLVIRGDMFRLLKDHHKAILSYSAAPLLDPHGKSLPLALLNMGEVYFRDLRDNPMSRNVYQQVIDKYPAGIEAARASIFLAEVDESERNYGQAVSRLEETIQRFPFVEMRIECLARIGRIQLENLRAPDKAVATYHKIVEEYPSEPRAAEALIKVGDIYERNREYRYAVDTYRRLAELFPDHPVTPGYLFQAAELAERRLKDRPLAEELYGHVAGRYPATEQGRKAARKTGK